MNEKKIKLKWYESGYSITGLLITTILAAIICSQSFAVGDSSLSVFTSVINHNSSYLFVLIYFILLLTNKGKRYFNYLNVILIFIYLISTITSFLTLIQSFSLITISVFLENIILFVYLVHVMLRDTRLWDEFHLARSPFNEISNEGYYYAIVVVVVFGLIVNLISTVVVSGLFVSVLDAIYVLLFGRYIYLYRDYLDYNKIDSDNEGNFDEIKKDIKEALDKTDFDDKVVDAAEKVVDTANDVANKVTDTVKGKKKTKKGDDK